MIDFIIVGAMKAGSTFLSNLIKDHPDIHIPSGEVHFFNNDINYSGGSEKYAELLRISEDSKGKLIGEKTPTYAVDPKVPERIFNYNPNTKLVWILRDPISRAYSHYWFWVQHGRVKCSFNEAIRRELELEGKYDVNESYLLRGRYVEQLERYSKFFPKENMHVIIFEEFVKDQESGLRKLSEFLGIDASKYPFDYLVSKKVNKHKTKIPRSLWLQNLAFKLWFNKRFDILYRIVFRLNVKPIHGYPKIDIQSEEKLSKYFSSYNKSLEEFLNRKITWK